jgi:phospholipid/cholesterol/gamma-HCH transport system ATP-binding protein
MTQGASDDRETKAGEHYIEFKNVSISFGEHAVLQDVSFFVDRGETLVIMGRSGVGKSVSLKIIMGFLKPDAGRVLIAGEDVTDWSEDRFAGIRREVTMVFQSGALFDSLTVAENVAFPLMGREGMDEEKREARVAELLDMLEVKDLADSLPADLATGAKRSVAIARALAQDPEAILYDEPTTMVDPLMSAHIGDLILKLKEKVRKTSIVVTHDTHLARKIGDRLVFLHQGGVVFCGTWKEFEDSSDAFLQHFRREDEQVPALDLVE